MSENNKGKKTSLSTEALLAMDHEQVSFYAKGRGVSPKELVNEALDNDPKGAVNAMLRTAGLNYNG